MSRMLGVAASLLLFGVAAPAPPPAVLRFSPRPNRAREIHWRAFGPTAFDEARRAGKPLFLDLSAIWCHWCHVFDETTLSDPAVIALLNDRFVPMRVDADQNPQVESRYLMGGWPTSAFLADDGSVLGGGTYLPSDAFKRMAQEVLEGYAGDREALRRRLGTGDMTPRDELGQGPLDPRAAVRIGAETMAQADPEHGGFGDAPKFPQGPALALLGYLGRTRANMAAARFSQATLGRMAAGGIFDPVEGGFFRYAMHRDWSSPHCEKMLAGNAEILLALCETYAATRDESLRMTAMSVAGYLTTHLWDEKAGGFYASQDADEVYYQQGAAGRAKRAAPFIDRTFLADRMALAARAFIRAAEIFGEPDLARYGERAMDLVLARMRAPSGAVFHARSSAPGAPPRLPGLLVDQAQVALALVDLAGWTGKDRYLRSAVEIVGAAQRQLGDPAGPGYFDLPVDQAGPGLTGKRIKPFAGNVELAWAMLALGEALGDAALSKQGAQTLAAFAGRARGLEAADFARAADLATGQVVRLMVVGPASRPATRALLLAAARFDDPRRLVRLLDSSRGPVHLGELVFPAGRPAVYACAGTACSRPIDDPSQVAEKVHAFVGSHLMP